MVPLHDGGGHELAPNRQTSVKFRDFAELCLRRLLNQSLSTLETLLILSSSFQPC